jgi:hypothetical protein
MLYIGFDSSAALSLLEIVIGNWNIHEIESIEHSSEIILLTHEVE